MIIKSVTRKQASFGQLLDYLERGRPDERFRFHHNLYSNRREAVREEFEENAQHLKQRQGGVFLYHEILSIKKTQKISELLQKERLFEIAKNYLLSRAPRSLAYGVLHDDKGAHLHYHLMISANEVGRSERIRLSKSQFAEIKTQLELWVLERYPELEQTRVMGKVASGEKLSRAGGELKRRTGKTPERDDLKERLRSIFRLSEDRGDFFTLLERAQVRIYARGQSIGFEDLKTGRKHRLKTLGLEGEFAEVNARISRRELSSESSPTRARPPAQRARAEARSPEEETARRPPTGMTEEALQEAQARLAQEMRDQATREAQKRARGAPERSEGHSHAERGDDLPPEQGTGEKKASTANTTAQTENQTEAELEAETETQTQTPERGDEAEEARQAAIERRRREAAQFRAGRGFSGAKNTADSYHDADAHRKR